ncbi:MAG: hypothetical protein JO199_06380, partial [Candidatus Eremiobacteraeota bacterium]|nr:hypothetical protein [Candidatus Eremiobacteraeota bacterium]
MTGEALDPLTATVFVAIFAACVLLTKHRPAFGAAALVLADPFALSRDVFATTVTIPKVALLGVLVGLCAYAGNWARLRTYPAPYLIAAFVLYFLGTLASVPGAEYVAPALRETLKSVQYLGFFVA